MTALRYKVVDFIRDYWPPVCTLVFAVGAFTLQCLQAASLFAGFWFWVAFIGLLGLGVVGGIVQVKRQKALSALEQELQNLKELRDEIPNHIRAVFDGYLTHLGAERLQFRAAVGDPDRITIYVYDRPGDCFTIVGRHARNFEFARCRNPSRPITEGCLAKAWENGHFFIGDLPDPKPDTATYIDRQFHACGMPKRRAQGLTMKARTYFAARIDGSHGEPPIGVLVLESTDANRFRKDELCSIFLGHSNGGNSGEVALIGRMLRLFAPYIPTQSDAEGVEQ